MPNRFSAFLSYALAYTVRINRGSPCNQTHNRDEHDNQSREPKSSEAFFGNHNRNGRDGQENHRAPENQYPRKEGLAEFLFRLKRRFRRRHPGIMPLTRSAWTEQTTRPVPILSCVCSRWAYRDETNSGTPASASYSSSVKCSDAAATFSSRWSTELVPGMGSMMGVRRRSQARATCFGVA